MVVMVVQHLLITVNVKILYVLPMLQQALVNINGMVLVHILIAVIMHYIFLKMTVLQYVVKILL